MKFNNRELGCYLEALGTEMMSSDLSLGAAMDGNSNESMRRSLTHGLKVYADLDDASAELKVEDLFKLEESELLELLGGDND